MIKLEQLASPSRKSTLESPVDHLFACHERISDRLDTIERVAGHLQINRQESLDALASVFRFFDTNGIWHTLDEEESIFPRILPRLTAVERAYLDLLHHQHQEAEEAYSDLRQFVTGNGDDPARYRHLAARLCNIYRAHIASENSVLLEICRRVLTPAELVEISDEMKHRREANHV